MMREKRQAESQEAVFYGEEQCAAKAGCRNKAYFRLTGGVLSCGVHSRNKPRRELSVNPNAAQREADMYRAWEELVERAASENRSASRRGTLTVGKLMMMKAAPHIDGVRNVFPNNKHQNRRDGFGCASLSPMRLGPTQHWQPDLPQALSIENYHQFNKVFGRDVVRSPRGEITIKASFYEMRDAAYRDPVPHRRKYEDEKGTNGNRNVPLVCVHLTRNGVERWYTYIESRYFYCREYERLAKETADFEILRRMLERGYNLQIVGYDGHAVDKPLYELYTTEWPPFGHELVLYTLLSVDNPDEYPWNVYYNKHRNRYE
jgi:hypothetical protein